MPTPQEMAEQLYRMAEADRIAQASAEHTASETGVFWDERQGWSVALLARNPRR